MISIKDYAMSKGVSTQAVYKQIKHHEKELKGLIVKQNRTRFLTDEAIEYLNAQSEQTPSIIMQADNSERIEELENENRNLLLKITSLQEALLQEKDRVDVLKQEKIDLLEQQNEPKGFFSRFKQKK